MKWVSNMSKSIYDYCKEFKRKFPGTISWRMKQHCSIVEKHLNDDEVVLYAFCAQRNEKWHEIFFTSVFVFTNKRMMLGRKGLVGNYTFTTITPDMLNDFEVRSNILWGSIEIDTIKEHFTISNISKKALPEIEDAISKYMMNEKLRLLKKKK